MGDGMETVLSRAKFLWSLRKEQLMQVLLAHEFQLTGTQAQEVLRNIPKAKQKNVPIIPELTTAPTGSASSSPSQSAPSSPASPDPQRPPKIRKLDTGNVPNNKNKKRSKFDWSKYRYRHVALKIAYLGANYHGFSAQDDQKTVEGELYRAVETCCLVEDVKKCRWSRCGRTDRGVNSMAQIISLYIRSNLKDDHHLGMLPLETGRSGITEERNEEEGEQSGEVFGNDNQTADEAESKQAAIDVGHEEQDADGRKEFDFPLLLNAALPPDIRVLGWAPVPLDFSARFSCRYRVYRYLFFADELNLPLMHQAAQDLVGEHDFRNLCKMDVVASSHFHRVIKSASIREMDPECPLLPRRGPLPAPGQLAPDRWCEFEIVGNAFLYHQVRCLVSVLLLVGRGLEGPGIVRELLDLQKFPLKPNYPLASEVPLILFECGYDKLRFRHSMENEARVFSDLHKLWRETMLSARLLEYGWQTCVANARLLTLQDKQSSLSSSSAPVKDEREEMAGEGKEHDERAELIRQAASMSRAFRGQQCSLRTRKPERHVPLRSRPTEKSYDARVSKLSGAKLQRQQQAALQSLQFQQLAKDKASALVATPTATTTATTTTTTTATATATTTATTINTT